MGVCVLIFVCVCAVVAVGFCERVEGGGVFGVSVLVALCLVSFHMG